MKSEYAMQYVTQNNIVKYRYVITNLSQHLKLFIFTNRL